MVRAAIDDFAEREAARLLAAHDGLIERIAVQIAKHFEPIANRKPPPKRGHAENLAAAVHLIARMNNEDAAIAVALIRAVKAPTDTGTN
jgi:hypothetical protein